MRWIIATTVVLILAAALWWLDQVRQTELHRSVEPSTIRQPAPEPRYPLPVADPEPEAQAQVPESAPVRIESPAPAEASPSETPVVLPDLAQSDSRALETLAGLAGSNVVGEWIKPEFVIPRTVAFVHSLDGPAPALRIRPVVSLDSEPLTEPVASNDEAIRAWTAANAPRYDRLVEALEAVSPRQAADAYARHYPLFQQAWRELGESEAYFNDRLVDVIDHLVATPEVELPFKVQAFEGRLIFTDERLEALSWGQKMLIRAGPDHADAVKSWLGRFRAALLDAGAAVN